MTFTLMWVKGPFVIGSEAFDDLDAAKTHADDLIDQMQQQFGATAVKIIDQAGTPQFLKSLSRNG
jgi:hypothetical protein